MWVVTDSPSSNDKTLVLLVRNSLATTRETAIGWTGSQEQETIEITSNMSKDKATFSLFESGIGGFLKNAD